MTAFQTLSLTSSSWQCRRVSVASRRYYSYLTGLPEAVPYVGFGAERSEGRIRSSRLIASRVRTARSDSFAQSERKRRYGAMVELKTELPATGRQAALRPIYVAGESSRSK